MCIVFKKLCRRCGGSGNLLRPTKKKLLVFKPCTTCAQKGVRFLVTKDI